MQFDAENPAYFAWLTSEAGKQQQIEGLGIECSETQLQDIAEIQKNVGYVRGFMYDALGVMKCFDEAHKLDEDISKIAAQNATLALNMPATMLAHADAQQKLDNLLSAGSAYISRAQARIRRTFGEDSEEFKNFEAARHHEYDEKISYRIMQNLRNFSQHENTPVSVMPTTMKHNEGSLTISTKVLLDRKELIESTRVQQRVRRELNELESDQIDLMPLIDMYYESFMIITKKSVANLVLELQMRCQPYLDLYGKQPVENVSVPVILRPRKTENNTRFLIGYPPMQELAVFDFILNDVLSNEDRDAAT